MDLRRNSYWAESISSIMKKTEVNLNRLQKPGPQSYERPSTSMVFPRTHDASFEYQARPRTVYDTNDIPAPTRQETMSIKSLVERLISDKLKSQKQTIHNLSERVSALESDFPSPRLDKDYSQKSIINIESKFTSEIRRLETTCMGLATAEDMKITEESIKNTHLKLFSQIEGDMRELRARNDSNFEGIYALIENKIKDLGKRSISQKEIGDLKDDILIEVDSKIRKLQERYNNQLDEIIDNNLRKQRDVEKKIEEINISFTRYSDNHDSSYKDVSRSLNTHKDNIIAELENLKSDFREKNSQNINKFDKDLENLKRNNENSLNRLDDSIQEINHEILKIQDLISKDLGKLKIETEKLKNNSNNDLLEVEMEDLKRKIDTYKKSHDVTNLVSKNDFDIVMNDIKVQITDTKASFSAQQLEINQFVTKDELENSLKMKEVNIIPENHDVKESNSDLSVFISKLDFSDKLNEIESEHINIKNEISSLRESINEKSSDFEKFTTVVLTNYAKLHDLDELSKELDEFKAENIRISKLCEEIEDRENNKENPDLSIYVTKTEFLDFKTQNETKISESLKVYSKHEDFDSIHLETQKMKTQVDTIKTSLEEDYVKLDDLINLRSEIDAKMDKKIDQSQRDPDLSSFATKQEIDILRVEIEENNAKIAEETSLEHSHPYLSNFVTKIELQTLMTEIDHKHEDKAHDQKQNVDLSQIATITDLNDLKSDIHMNFQSLETDIDTKLSITKTEIENKLDKQTQIQLQVYATKQDLSDFVNRTEYTTSIEQKSAKDNMELEKLYGKIQDLDLQMVNIKKPQLQSSAIFEDSEVEIIGIIPPRNNKPVLEEKASDVDLIEIDTIYFDLQNTVAQNLKPQVNIQNFLNQNKQLESLERDTHENPVKPKDSELLDEFDSQRVEIFTFKEDEKIEVSKGSDSFINISRLQEKGVTNSAPFENENIKSSTETLEENKHFIDIYSDDVHQNIFYKDKFESENINIGNQDKQTEIIQPQTKTIHILDNITQDKIEENFSNLNQTSEDKKIDLNSSEEVLEIESHFNSDLKGPMYNVVDKSSLETKASYQKLEVNKNEFKESSSIKIEKINTSTKSDLKTQYENKTEVTNLENWTDLSVKSPISDSEKSSSSHGSNSPQFWGNQIGIEEKSHVLQNKDPKTDIITEVFEFENESLKVKDENSSLTEDKAIIIHSEAYNANQDMLDFSSPRERVNTEKAIDQESVMIQHEVSSSNSYSSDSEVETTLPINFSHEVAENPQIDLELNRKSEAPCIEYDFKFVDIEPDLYSPYKKSDQSISPRVSQDSSIHASKSIDVNSIGIYNLESGSENLTPEILISSRSIEEDKENTDITTPDVKVSLHFFSTQINSDSSPEIIQEPQKSFSSRLNASDRSVSSSSVDTIKDDKSPLAEIISPDRVISSILSPEIYRQEIIIIDENYTPQKSLSNSSSSEAFHTPLSSPETTKNIDLLIGSPPFHQEFSASFPNIRDPDIFSNTADFQPPKFSPVEKIDNVAEELKSSVTESDTEERHVVANINRADVYAEMIKNIDESDSSSDSDSSISFESYEIPDKNVGVREKDHKELEIQDVTVKNIEMPKMKLNQQTPTKDVKIIGEGFVIKSPQRLEQLLSSSSDENLEIKNISINSQEFKFLSSPKSNLSPKSNFLARFSQSLAFNFLEQETEKCFEIVSDVMMRNKIIKTPKKIIEALNLESDEIGSVDVIRRETDDISYSSFSPHSFIERRSSTSSPPSSDSGASESYQSQSSSEFDRQIENLNKKAISSLQQAIQQSQLTGSISASIGSSIESEEDVSFSDDLPLPQ